MSETHAALKHILTTLAAAEGVTDLVGTRIYAGTAPRETAYPFITVNPAGGTDRRVPGADGRIMSRPRWLVLAVHNQNDLTVTGEIATAVDAALTGSGDDLTIYGQAYRVQAVHREEPLDQLPSTEGSTYVRSGGYYRTQVHKL